MTRQSQSVETCPGSITAYGYGLMRIFSAHLVGFVPEGSIVDADLLEEMEQMPTVENWLRFKVDLNSSQMRSPTTREAEAVFPPQAEERYIRQRVRGLKVSSIWNASKCGAQ